MQPEGWGIALGGLELPRAPAADWPPRPHYRFDAAGQPRLGTWKPIALPGAARGTVERQVVHHRDTEVLEGFFVSRPEWKPVTAMDLLCRLAQVVPPPASLDRQFTGAESFRLAVTDARDRRREALRQVHHKLVATGQLSAAEAAVLDGPVAVHLRDERGDGSVPLPVIPPAR